MVNLWIALALGVIFIIIPVVVMGTLGVNMFGKMLKGFFSMALKVGVIALFVYWLVQWDSFVFDVLFVIAMLFYSAIEVKVRARLRSTSYVIPVLAGLFAGTMLTGASRRWRLSVRVSCCPCSPFCLPAQPMFWLAPCRCTTPDCAITTSSTIICSATVPRIMRH